MVVFTFAKEALRCFHSKVNKNTTPPPFKVSQLMQLSSHFVPQTSPPPVNSVLLQSQNKHLVRANCQAESCLRHKTATDMNIPLLRKPTSWAAYSVGKKKKKRKAADTCDTRSPPKNYMSCLNTNMFSYIDSE